MEIQGNDWNFKKHLFQNVFHILDSLGGRSTLVTMGTGAREETSRGWLWSEVGGVTVAVRRRIWLILSSTQPADRRASAS